MGIYNLSGPISDKTTVDLVFANRHTSSLNLLDKLKRTSLISDEMVCYFMKLAESSRKTRPSGFVQEKSHKEARLFNAGRTRFLRRFGKPLEEITQADIDQQRENLANWELKLFNSRLEKYLKDFKGS